MQKQTTAAKIQATFFALAKTMPAEHITIHSLAAAAGISRSTFYAYYENLTDLAADLENQIVNPILEILDKYWQQPVGSAPCAAEILRFTRQHGDEIYTLRYLKNGNLTVKFSRALKSYLHKKLRYLQIPYDEFQIFFAVSIMLNLMIPSPIFPGERPDAFTIEEIAAHVARNTEKIFL